VFEVGIEKYGRRTGERFNQAFAATKSRAYPLDQAEFASGPFEERF